MIQLKKEIHERDGVLKHMRAERLGISNLAIEQPRKSNDDNESPRQFVLPSDPSIERIEASLQHEIEEEPDEDESQ